MTHTPPSSGQYPPLVSSALAKASRRLLPGLFILYIIAYLDRINVSFAALAMNQDIGLGSEAYGLGAGIFFLGYVLFEIPSNLILNKVGARRWIARIMVSWGLATVALATVWEPKSFMTLRFLLGAAEAGFFPGIILYLTYWFPTGVRARAVALFMTATPVAGLIGSPVSGWIMQMHGMMGLAGWRWLFILEGLPAVVLGVLVWLLLPDSPAQAAWLEPDERDALEAQLNAERAAVAASHLSGLRQGLTSPRVWLLGFVYFCSVLAMYALVMWLPQIVGAITGGDAFSVGLDVMVAYGFACVGMVAIGASSDRFHERRWHLTGSFCLCLSGMLTLTKAASLPAVLTGASLAAMGIWGMLGPFWGLATSYMTGAAAAAGIALINSMGNLGGFLGPYVMGWIKANTGGFTEGFLIVAGLIVLGAVPVLLMRPAGGVPQGRGD
ncbi:MFS transporter [Fundidesulfovibrio soli]|uniref:MFS transporter n=1 Tax=Fundidesulfovibrio soli TaxID=2922716 RepID=UPI001FB0222F|nr:MFS transporter [Fundidesulfovibrio soli]